MKKETMFLFLAFVLLGSAIADPELLQKLEKTEHKHLDTPLRALIPELSEITREGIERCFESINNGQSSNSTLFDDANTLKHVLEEYYAHFDEHQVGQEQIDNLVKSLRNIVRHLRECSVSFSRDHHTFKVGLNSMSDKDIKSILIQKPQKNGLRNFLQQAEEPVFLEDLTWGGLCGKAESFNSKALPETYDFRVENPQIRNVTNQKQCSSCWAITAATIVEGAYLNVGQKIEKLSAQYMLDFNKINAGCGGGWGYEALKFVKEHGIARDADYPYQEKVTNNSDPGAAVKVKDYCYINGNVSEEKRKFILNKYGPSWFAMIAGDADLLSYKSGIYKPKKLENCGDTAHWHAMVLVGYTKDTWIVKNSWGDRWGDKGFVHIKRGVNACKSDQDVGFVSV